VIWDTLRDAAARYARVHSLNPNVRTFPMHGFHPLSKREESIGAPTWWSSEWTFGVVALIALSALAILAALFAPEVIIL
jgi:hypothetical protein